MPVRSAALGRSTRPPPLENGDRLSRYEFERRYEAMPAGVKAELIDGVVYVSSPVKSEHADPQSLLVCWLAQYAIETPGVVSSVDATVRLDEETEPQPDAHLRLVPEAGGRVVTDDDGFLRGPVELACEVCASSESYDLNAKKSAYRRNGVREYLALLVREARVVWFELEQGEYRELAADRSRAIRSRAFPGLWLDARALIAGDGARLLATLRRGLASQDHAAFARALRAKLRRRRP